MKDLEEMPTGELKLFYSGNIYFILYFLALRNVDREEQLADIIIGRLRRIIHLQMAIFEYNYEYIKYNPCFNYAN